MKVTLVGWRKKFIYSSLSVKPPHRKEAAHFIKKQTYKRSSFKKYYKSSLQAVKVKLQSGCYVHKRKQQQQQPSVQHRELESTEEPEVLVRRTRASTETARGKKKRKNIDWHSIMSHQHFVSHQSDKTKQKWTQVSDLMQGLQRTVAPQSSAFNTVLFFSGGIVQRRYVTADGSQCF